MHRLTGADQIWTLKPTDEDLAEGARYASISLPWTFNRMMINTSAKGQCSRALNVAKGIVSQEVLRRRLAELGVEALIQRKSHRVDDLYDLRIAIDGRMTRVDVKTMNYYTDYEQYGRSSFRPQLIAEQSSYSGRDWRQFFPMLIPHTQIGQEKEVYCFAIASSVDFRRQVRDAGLCDITAFPYDECLPFMCSPQLCDLRENAGKGFWVTCAYTPNNDLLSADELQVALVGEWDGKIKCEEIIATPANPVLAIGPFSALTCVKMDRDSYRTFYGSLTIAVSLNEFQTPFRNSRKVNINTIPENPLRFSREDFCDLRLPYDYTLYFLGWIPKEEFLSSFRRYPAYVWPDDKRDRALNQGWSQITEKDMDLISRLGIADRVSDAPSRINAGLLKTSGRGGGACCYVYPNIGRGGGVRETNLYVLPQDLYTMDSLLK